MSSELTRLTAVELAEKIHSRQVSAVEVAQAHLDRIAAADGTVHAFLHVAAESALQSAALVDAALDAGTPPASPLAGVPLENVFRADERRPGLTQEQALACAPAAEDGRFRVPQILGEEQ